LNDLCLAAVLAAAADPFEAQPRGHKHGAGVKCGRARPDEGGELAALRYSLHLVVYAILRPAGTEGHFVRSLGMEKIEGSGIDAWAAAVAFRDAVNAM
jgi:hypothetical protein